MRDKENILEVAALLPDFMGFIFFPPSPRYVGDDFSIPPEFPEATERVGVFVNEGIETVLDKVARHKLNVVQLHGNETPAICQTLKSKGVKVIKVFSINDDFDFSITKQYQPTVDFFLFDTKGKYYGGNAQTFSWEILKKYNQQVPFFLSGGLSLDNLSGIADLRDMNLYALDVNSGVEIKPGWKDVERISTLKDRLVSLIK